MGQPEKRHRFECTCKPFPKYCAILNLCCPHVTFTVRILSSGRGPTNANVSISDESVTLVKDVLRQCRCSDDNYTPPWDIRRDNYKDCLEMTDCSNSADGCGKNICNDCYKYEYVKCDREFCSECVEEGKNIHECYYCNKNSITGNAMMMKQLSFHMQSMGQRTKGPG